MIRLERGNPPQVWSSDRYNSIGFSFALSALPAIFNPYLGLADSA
jgi:hypothetical protein